MKGTIAFALVAVASAVYCGPGVTGLWSGAKDLIIFKTPQCILPTARQLSSCLGERRVHLVGDGSLQAVAQAIQSEYLGCRVDKATGGWQAAAGASDDAARFCQGLHRVTDPAKRAWTPRPLGPLALTYERADTVEGIRATRWWRTFVVGPPAKELALAAAAAEVALAAPTGTPPPLAAKRSLRAPPPEGIPDTVILSADPRLALLRPVRGRSATAAAAVSAADSRAALAAYLASVRALLEELARSEAFQAYWGEPAATGRGDGARVFWRLAPPPERDTRSAPQALSRLLAEADAGVRAIVAAVAPAVYVISQHELVRHEAADIVPPGARLVTTDGATPREPIQALLGKHLLMSAVASVAARLGAPRQCFGRPLVPDLSSPRLLPTPSPTPLPLLVDGPEDAPPSLLAPAGALNESLPGVTDQSAPAPQYLQAAIPFVASASVPGLEELPEQPVPSATAAGLPSPQTAPSDLPLASLPTPLSQSKSTAIPSALQSLADSSASTPTLDPGHTAKGPFDSPPAPPLADAPTEADSHTPTVLASDSSQTPGEEISRAPDFHVAEVSLSLPTLLPVSEPAPHEPVPSANAAATRDPLAESGLADALATAATQTSGITGHGEPQAGAIDRGAGSPQSPPLPTGNDFKAPDRGIVVRNDSAALDDAAVASTPGPSLVAIEGAGALPAPHVSLSPESADREPHTPTADIVYPSSASAATDTHVSSGSDATALVSLPGTVARGPEKGDYPKPFVSPPLIASLSTPIQAAPAVSLSDAPAVGKPLEGEGARVSEGGGKSDLLPGVVSPLVLASGGFSSAAASSAPSAIAAASALPQAAGLAVRNAAIKAAASPAATTTAQTADPWLAITERVPGAASTGVSDADASRSRDADVTAVWRAMDGPRRHWKPRPPKPKAKKSKKGAGAAVADELAPGPPPPPPPALILRVLEGPSVLPTAGGLIVVLVIVCCARRCSRRGAPKAALLGGGGAGVTVAAGLASASASATVTPDPHRVSTAPLVGDTASLLSGESHSD